MSVTLKLSPRRVISNSSSSNNVKEDSLNREVTKFQLFTNGSLPSCQLIKIKKEEIIMGASGFDPEDDPADNVIVTDYTGETSINNNSGDYGDDVTENDQDE